jgi:hypothetical protein
VHDPLAYGHDAIKIIPGMPAQVFIKTGRATVALYALKSLLARRSFLPSSSSVHRARTAHSFIIVRLIACALAPSSWRIPPPCRPGLIV